MTGSPGISRVCPGSALLYLCDLAFANQLNEQTDRNRETLQIIFKRQE